MSCRSPPPSTQWDEPVLQVGQHVLQVAQRLSAGGAPRLDHPAEEPSRDAVGARSPREGRPSDMPGFHHADVLPLGPDATEYRRLDLPARRDVDAAGRTFLQIDPATLTALVREAVCDISHYLRPAHLAQLRAIVDDPEASANDRFVATDLLRNACVSAGGVLPMCQDTGTAIVVGKRSETVLTGGNDEEAISRGVFEAYQRSTCATRRWRRRRSGTSATPAPTCPRRWSCTPRRAATRATSCSCMAKGGGSANKTFLYQETKALLNPSSRRGSHRRRDRKDRHPLRSPQTCNYPNQKIKAFAFMREFQPVIWISIQIGQRVAAGFRRGVI